MVFKLAREQESELLDVLTKYFSTPEKAHKLDILSKHAGGFEGWFQIEIIVALHDAGYDVTTEGKKGLGADLVVNGLGIELRAY